MQKIKKKNMQRSNPTTQRFT